MDRGDIEVEHGGIVQGGGDPLRPQGRDPGHALRRAPPFQLGNEGARILGLLFQDVELILAGDHQDAQRAGERGRGEALRWRAVERCGGGGQRAHVALP